MNDLITKEYLINKHIKVTKKWDKISTLFTYLTSLVYLVFAITFCWIWFSIINKQEVITNEYVGYLCTIGLIALIFTFASKAVEKYCYIVSISLINDINHLEKTTFSMLAIERTMAAFNYIYAMISLIISMIIVSIVSIVSNIYKILLTEKIATIFGLLFLSLIIFFLIKMFHYLYSTRSINNALNQALNEYYKKNK